jgi:VIT1/CCC1 family predicted Fe2+/Mn2+ transporter
MVRDIVIGMSDGLTMPFALAAGLSGSVQSTSIVITAGPRRNCGRLDRDGPRWLSRLVRALRERPDAWVDFMMRFELGLERPDPKRALVSAATIAGAYVAGGLIPLAPYFMFGEAARALTVSVACTLLALFQVVAHGLHCLRRAPDDVARLVGSLVQ